MQVDIKGIGLIPGSGRSPGGGYGNPLQYSCQENPKDRGAWWAKVHGVTKSQKETTLCTTNLGENPSQSLAGCCPLGPQVLHSSWLSRLKREATEMWVMSTELITTQGKSTRKRRKPWQKGWAKSSVLIKGHQQTFATNSASPTLFAQGVKRSTSCQSKTGPDTARSLNEQKQTTEKTVCHWLQKCGWHKWALKSWFF